MSKISKGSLCRKPEGVQRREPEQWRDQVRALVAAMIAFVDEQAGREVAFKDIEPAIQQHLAAIGRAVVGLFLEVAEQRVAATVTLGKTPRGYHVRPAICRALMTVFGVIWYWRTYLRALDSTGGYHPLDAQLGLTADRISPNVLSTNVRLATRMSFEEAREVAQWLWPVAPSTEVVQNAVQGLGACAEQWFAEAPLPDDDGEVLVIQVDSKGAPTATEEELRKRRGPRKRRAKSVSPRHRGRHLRQSWTRKPRRKKGDKSKNAKMATLVVMYTLRRQAGQLLGPINKRYYASFAPKRHAVEHARREANRRGFAPESGRLIQVVTDGDNDLREYVQELFPEARHTLDLLHVVERLWTAGECLLAEGTEELRRWVSDKRELLLLGDSKQVLADLRRRLDKIPKTGPGNKGRRQRLGEVLRYLSKRLDQMNYREAMEQDLELGTGAVEGAIKNLIGKRMDHGGMRWIKERAEALLKLRCIDANGHWDPFIQRVHDRLRDDALLRGARVRLQRRQPIPLPTVDKVAA